MASTAPVIATKIDPVSPTEAPADVPAASASPLQNESILNMGDEIVRLKVGAENVQKTFLVHKKLLTERIPYFATMFNGNWKEGKEQEATFPDDKVQAFDVMLSWVYFGTLRPLEITNNPSIKTHWNPIDLYILAEKLLLPHLQDLTMDAIYEFEVNHKYLLKPKEVRKIYDGTSERSGLRRYAAQTVVCILLKSKLLAGWENQQIQDLVQEISDLNRDVITILRGSYGRSLTDPRSAPKQSYHNSKFSGVVTLEDKPVGRDVIMAMK